jgi:serine-type D-Ala-D-Ala carboxypeptidase (penicillin-binding protein 5/6)
VTRHGALVASVVLAASLLSARPVAASDDWMPEGARTPAAFVIAVGDRVLRTHRDAVRRQPASLAKLAGALVALDADRAAPGLLAAVVRIDRAAAAAGGTRLGLVAGERVRADALLEGMLLGSANDACLALAVHVAGDVERFVARMNALAAALGMRDTRFVDPCGFDRPGQHTTAADLLRLARAALADAVLVAIVEKEAARIAVDGAGEGAGRALVARNTNALLGRYDGAFGLKTGFTGGAGPCLVAVARRGPHVVTVVLLGARDRWPVSVAMLDHAFEQATGVPRIGNRTTIGEPDW